MNFARGCQPAVDRLRNARPCAHALHGREIRNARIGLANDKGGPDRRRGTSGKGRSARRDAKAADAALELRFGRKPGGRKNEVRLRGANALVGFGRRQRDRSPLVLRQRSFERSNRIAKREGVKRIDERIEKCDREKRPRFKRVERFCVTAPVCCALFVRGGR